MTRYFFIGWIGIVVLLTACERPDVRFPQFVQDDLVVWTITWELGLLLENELATHPSGDTSFTVPCPGSGSVQATGTIHPNRTADLSLVLASCGFTSLDEEGNIAAVLNFTGPMTFAFAQDATGHPRQILRSDALQISGTVTTFGESRNLDELCPFSSTFLENAVSVALIGKICARDTTSSMSHIACGQ